MTIPSPTIVVHTTTTIMAACVNRLMLPVRAAYVPCTSAPSSNNAETTNPRISRFRCRSTASSDRRSTSSLLLLMWASRRLEMSADGIEPVRETGFDRTERNIENCRDFRQREFLLEVQNQDGAARR